MSKLAISIIYIKKITKLILGIFFLILDYFLLLIISKPNEKITSLVIIRVDNIGDFILWSRNMYSLNTLYPRSKYKYILIANSIWSDVARNLNFFDEIIEVDRNKYIKSIAYRFSIAKKIRLFTHFVALNPTYSREVFWSDSLMRFISAQNKIGLYGNTSNTNRFLKIISNKFYNKLIKIEDSLIDEDRINRNFFKSLGFIGPCEIVPSFQFSSSPLLSSSHEYFGIFPGSSWSGRNWPASYYAEISDKIHTQFGLYGVILGSKSESSIARNINKLVNFPMIDLTGKTNLVELFSTIHNLKLLISNETSAAHIGAILNVPTVCIVGGGHFGRFLPYESNTFPPIFKIANFYMPCYGCNWQCPYVKQGGSVPCISGVTVDNVFSHIIDIYNPITIA